MNNTSTTLANDKYAGMSPSYYWFFILFMVLLSMFGSFVNDMYIPALPEMTHAFGCSVSTVQLGLSFGMIGLGIGQIVFGPISDKYGRKGVLNAGMIIFAVGGTASIFSPNIWYFIACRLVQGIGASTGYFLARTMPADVSSGRALAKIMALTGAINGVAPASAPVLGGLFAHLFGWRSIFIFLTAMALLMLLVNTRVKETLPPDRRAKGSLISTFEGYGSLFKQYKFMTHVMLKGAALGLLFAYIASAPFIIQTHYGYSDIVFGLYMGFNALFVVAGSLTALKFEILKKAGVYGSWGLGVVIVGQAFALWHIDSFLLYEVLNCLMLFCLGLIFTMSNTLAMNEGRANAGRASAILGVMGYIFGAIATPLTGLGDILHSTVFVYTGLVIITVIFAFMSRRIAPELSGPAVEKG
ncbi:MAG: multidrug effflux MFS transporter [Prevotella sp.]|nr:multidrug effflux MFS transporter [Prevotella sp.]MCM1074362.1 multidrug effflux MFS transporter [Ruminococcus sp.]